MTKRTKRVGRPAAFTELLERMPGGRFIGDAWRDEEWVLLSITLEDQRSIPAPIQEVLEAFGSFETNEAGVVLTWVPTLAMEVVFWHCEEYVCQAEDIALVDGAGDGATQAAAMAPLWVGDDYERMDEVLAAVLAPFTAAGIDPVTATATIAAMYDHDDPVTVAADVLGITVNLPVPA